MFKDPDFFKKVKNQKVLILLSIPFVLYVIIFCYVPLFGWVMAFQNYKPKDGMFHSKFVGMAKFERLFGDNSWYVPEGLKNGKNFNSKEEFDALVSKFPTMRELNLNGLSLKSDKNVWLWP